MHTFIDLRHGAVNRVAARAGRPAGECPRHVRIVGTRLHPARRSPALYGRMSAPVQFEHAFARRCAVRRRLNRPVWVKLSLVHRQTRFPPARFRWDDRTVEVAGEAPGTLHGWYRSTTGEWFGLVSYAGRYADRPPPAELELTDQLVPAEALRPRTYGRERRQ